MISALSAVKTFNRRGREDFAKVAQTAPGTTVKLTVSRDGKESEISVTLDEFKSSDSKAPEAGNDNVSGRSVV